MKMGWQTPTHFIYSLQTSHMPRRRVCRGSGPQTQFGKKDSDAARLKRCIIQ